MILSQDLGVDLATRLCLVTINILLCTDADGGVTDHAFVDDAILIEKYYVVDMMLGQGYTPLSTISVSVNANPRVNEGQLNHWMNFDVDW